MEQQAKLKIIYIRVYILYNGLQTPGSKFTKDFALVKLIRIDIVIHQQTSPKKNSKQHEKRNVRWKENIFFISF